ncbi:transcription termination/antitermination protein NusG [Alkalilacustris brevis]|uniref:transcription termination/antitermination protein NusG n=1 Tax=Alkalilacustris brevis TaxID=2026338 RepID=UPI001EE4D38E|nr:transcriptional activator RfaH [Alkalilacustris brevis]
MTSHMPSEHWFLAQYKPNAHRIAERNLMRQGFPTFLPLQEETRRARGRFVTRKQPLFPGYLFVALDMQRAAWRAVSSTFGIARLVSLGGEPKPVPCDLVAQLMLRCGENAEGTPPPPLPGPGDQVALTKGPFAGFVARIEAIAPDRRIWVLLDFLGRQTRVAAGAEQLRVI